MPNAIGNSRRIHVLMVVGALLLAALLVEIVSCTGLSIQRGRFFSPESSRTDALAIARLSVDDDEDLAAGNTEHGSRTVAHPYVGFVCDPSVDQGKGRLVDDQGFFITPSSPNQSSDRPFVIGVFGGSVANMLVFHESEFLADRIAQIHNAAGTDIRVRTFAMGGYKQPQQIMVLAWLLARGETLDVAINLDGFNEVALPVATNLQAGVHPFYPWGWQRRISTVNDMKTQTTEGEITYLNNLRGRRARAFAESWVSWSPTAHLSWRVLDRRLGARTAELYQDLQEHRLRERDFLSHGPIAESPSLDHTIGDCIDLWRRASAQMHALCESQDIAYYHFLQPNQYVPGSKPLSREERTAAFEADHPYRQPAVTGYPLLVKEGEQLRESGVRFVDLTGIFLGIHDPVYEDTCCHLNEYGNQLLAQEIVTAIGEFEGTVRGP